MRERERERGRERDRETDRDRQTDRQTDRQRQRDRERERDRERDAGHFGFQLQQVYTASDRKRAGVCREGLRRYTQSNFIICRRAKRKVSSGS